MKVTVLQENLARGLSIVSRAVSSRSTLPVLSNILIATDEGRLRLSATNLELGITCWIPARIDQDGSTTVPSRTFSDLVNTLPGDQVQIQADKGPRAPGAKLTGRVIGFLHADRLYSGRTVDEIDRDTVWAFAEGFGYAFERTVLLERMRRQHAEVRTALATAEKAPCGHCGMRP